MEIVRNDADEADDDYEKDPQIVELEKATEAFMGACINAGEIRVPNGSRERIVLDDIRDLVSLDGDDLPHRRVAFFKVLDLVQSQEIFVVIADNPGFATVVLVAHAFQMGRLAERHIQDIQRNGAHH